MVVDTFIPIRGDAVERLKASKYPYKIGVQVEFPAIMEHKGVHYHWYNKLGTDVQKGLPCACYQNTEGGRDRRIWLCCDGTITED